MEEILHEVDFLVPLSGSQLFDIHTKSTAYGLCSMFPGLDSETCPKGIRIYGKLNDYWYDRFNRAIFGLGDNYFRNLANDS